MSDDKTVWPNVGDKFRDSVGRVLTVTEVNKVDRLYRNIVGTIDGKPYATDKVIFDAIWAGGKL